MTNQIQSWWEWINHWMAQSSDNWHPLSSAVDGNPIVIGLHLLSGTVLALCFFIIAGLMTYASKTKGFISRPQKFTTFFFILFIALCGTTFVIREITFFYPLFWIYGSIKFVTAFAALLTTILYIKYYNKFLADSPTAEYVIDLKNKTAVAEKKVLLLGNHLEAWGKDVTTRIQTLKQEHNSLVDELQKKGLPVIDIHDTESGKDQILKSLDAIKKELENLTSNLENLDKLE